MFEATSDLQRVDASDIIKRDSKGYDLASGATLRIAQVETVGEDLMDREDELLEALDTMREEEEHAAVALMVTDIAAKGTKLFVSGDRAAVGRAFETSADSGVLDLPGVMSRKKQVAPKLLQAFSG